MTKAIWDLETPRGRLLPAFAAGLVPVLVALVVVGLLLVRPTLRGLDHAQEVLSAATELRSTSRALQRDVLLLIFDEGTREKTGARLEARVPEFRQLADRLGTALDSVDPERPGVFAKPMGRWPMGCRLWCNRCRRGKGSMPAGVCSRKRSWPMKSPPPAPTTRLSRNIRRT